MIIVDLSQVTYSTLMVQLGFDTKNANVEESMLRHMIINCLRSYNMAYKDKFGEMVIACDSTSWRNEVFPYYKANRKKSREESSLDWGQIFGIVNKIKEELKENLPYRVIDVPRAEADDIMFTLVKNSDILQKVLILSGDKDFIQLHTYGHIAQYDPTRKKWITHENPDEYLIEHIAKGDKGDGVPNVLSPDNCLVVGTRQGSITAKKLNSYKNFEEMEVLCKNPDFVRNWNRNTQLIDLSCCPTDIQENILEQYKKQSGKDRSKLLNYFMSHKLKILTENISDF